MVYFTFYREEVKFSRPKKPKKGGKPPTPPKNKDAASYDLNNVSIFKYENTISSSSTPNNNDSSTSSMCNINSTFVKDGQSFLAAVEKPFEQLAISTSTTVQQQQPQENKNSNGNEENVAPPPPDESGAKGIFKAPLPEKTTFLLLHLSLMRDYIDFEFQDLKKNLENHPKIK